LRSGLTEAAVIELVGRKPEHTERFKLKGRPDERYTVLEYYLAQTKTSPELRYWFLFDRSGLIGYGRGGERVARGLAYDLYCHWLAAYEAMVGELVDKLDARNHALAVEIASIPDRMRGYGSVKKANLQKAKTRETELFATFRVPARCC